MAGLELNLLDRCIWTPTASGSGTWTYSAAVTGYQSPTAAGAVNGTYGYAAQSSDLSQWEYGYGVWNGSTLTRTVLGNSSGGTSAISFSAAPSIMMTPLAESLSLTAVLALATMHGNYGGL